MTAIITLALASFFGGYLWTRAELLEPIPSTTVAWLKARQGRVARKLLQLFECPVCVGTWTAIAAHAISGGPWGGRGWVTLGAGAGLGAAMSIVVYQFITVADAITQAADVQRVSTLNTLAMNAMPPVAKPHPDATPQ